MLPSGEYVTVDDVAEHFKISVRTVYRMIEDKDITAVSVRKGKRPLFRVLRKSVVELELDAAG